MKKKQPQHEWIPIGEFPRHQPENSGTTRETIEVVMEMLKAIDEIANQIPEMAEMLLKEMKYSKDGFLRYTGPEFETGESDSPFNILGESSLRMKPEAALDFDMITDYVQNGEPGAGLPSALSPELLKGAINDIRQFFREGRQEDPEGNCFFTGPFCLMMKNVMDRREVIDEDEVYDYLKYYQLELELESLRRRQPSEQIVPATLETIFDPEREEQLFKYFEPPSGYAN